MKNRKYLIAIIIGVILTPALVVQAYQIREYIAVGGEWLLIPLLLLIVICTDSIKDFFLEEFEDREVDDETW